MIDFKRYKSINMRKTITIQPKHWGTSGYNLIRTEDGINRIDLLCISVWVLRLEKSSFLDWVQNLGLHCLFNPHSYSNGLKENQSKAIGLSTCKVAPLKDILVGHGCLLHLEATLVIDNNLIVGRFTPT